MFFSLINIIKHKSQCQQLILKFIFLRKYVVFTYTLIPLKPLKQINKISNINSLHKYDCAVLLDCAFAWQLCSNKLVVYNSCWSLSTVPSLIFMYKKVIKISKYLLRKTISSVYNLKLLLYIIFTNWMQKIQYMPLSRGNSTKHCISFPLVEVCNHHWKISQCLLLLQTFACN